MINHATRIVTLMHYAHTYISVWCDLGFGASAATAALFVCRRQSQPGRQLPNLAARLARKPACTRPCSTTRRCYCNRPGDWQSTESRPTPTIQDDKLYMYTVVNNKQRCAKIG